MENEKSELIGRTIRIADKEMMDMVLTENHHEMVGIVFNDTFSCIS